MVETSHTGFIQHVSSQPDIVGGLALDGIRLDLTRPGTRGWECRFELPVDTMLFSFAPYTSRFAVDSDRKSPLAARAMTFNFHPAGTLIAGSDLHHSGECLIVEFGNGLLDEALREAAGVTKLDRSLLVCSNPLISAMAGSLRHVAATVRRGEPVNTLFVEGASLALRAALAWAYRRNETGGRAAPPLSTDDPRIATTIGYIEAHLGEPLTVADIAAVAGLSPGHFARYFKAATGAPVWAYVQRRRCERAEELLLHTHLPIAEIAYACGFANQSHLTACFKQQFSITPAALRASR